MDNIKLYIKLNREDCELLSQEYNSCNDRLLFKCNSCNTTFGVSNGGVAEQCILCGKHEIVKASYNGNRIDEFIPFTISKNKAIETYKLCLILLFHFVLKLVVL